MKTKNRIWICPLIVIGLILILTNSCGEKDNDNNDPAAITDKDGNVYTSVTIGTQVWMAQNLKTNKYNDGTTIPNVTDNTAWNNLAVFEVPICILNGAFCWYNNNQVTYEDDYGKLYNFGAVETGKLCPTGWHVPNTTEWRTLTNQYKIYEYPIDPVDPYGTVGNELMESGTTHWISGNGTNETGYTALPGGHRSSDGTFRSIGAGGYYWTSTGGGDKYRGYAFYHPIPLGSFGHTPLGSMLSAREGLSVRCLKDN